MAAEKSGNRNKNKNKEMAARMKREGVCRTTGRCGVCYQIVTCESWKSRYTHICPGGRIRH